MTVHWNRFDTVATAAGSGVDPQAIIDLISDDESEFGELEGDYPRESKRDDVGTPTLEETLEQYDQQRPENIQIIPRNPE